MMTKQPGGSRLRGPGGPGHAQETPQAAQDLTTERGSGSKSLLV
jgi:hypothetical protein